MAAAETATAWATAWNVGAVALLNQTRFPAQQVRMRLAAEHSMARKPFGPELRRFVGAAGG